MKPDKNALLRYYINHSLKILYILQTLLKVVLLVYTCRKRILGTLLNVKILLIDKTTAATLLQREANLRKRVELSHL